MDKTNKYISLEKEAELENTSKERLRELATLNNDLAAIVASNVAAPPELLKELATHDDRAVKKTVTSNPNTPTQVVLKLGEEFPQELLDNPLFELLVLEDMNFLNNLEDYFLNLLIQQPEVPKFLLNYAANHQNEYIRETARMQVSLSGEIKGKYNKTAGKIIEEYLLSNRFFINFWQILSLYRKKLRMTYGTDNDSDVPGECFNILANFYQFLQFDLFVSEAIKFFLVHKLNVEPTILKRLAFDKNRNIRGGIASNPTTPPEVLELLTNDPEPSILGAIARNPNTPIKILKLFATSLDIEIRHRIAKNPSTPIETLKSLANESNEYINKALAENPSTPAEILESLTSNYNNSIFTAIASNPNTPVKTLQWLSNDLLKLVTKYVAENFDSLSEKEKSRTVSKECYKIAYKMAENPNTPVEILRWFAKNTRYSMRMRVAKNPNAPAEILQSLIATEDERDRKDKEVCCAVAAHPNTPVETLKTLAKDPDEQIRICVIGNPNIPVEVSSALVFKMTMRSKHQMCIRIAINPNTPPNLLEFMANNSNDLVREAIARNSNTPLEIIEKLADDSALLVRESVSDNPQCTFKIKEIIFKSFAKSDIPSLSRVALFLSDYAKSSVLVENSNSILWLERYAIACNANTPEDTLKKLAQDGNRIVCATAKESLQKYY